VRRGRADSNLRCYSVLLKRKEDAKKVSRPPTGTVTFLFTDIEGSTKLWEQDASAMQKALARHDEILRDAIEERGGYVFKTVGDAFCAAFPTAPEALEAALEAQRTLLSEKWGETGPLRVRMALHMGVAEERDGDYFGPPLNRVARLLSAGHGSQVLLSAAAQELVRDQLLAEASLMDLGERRLKDLFRPERVFQLVAAGLPSEFPPLRTLEGRPNNLPSQPTPLVGRERQIEEVAERLRGEEMRLLTLTGPGGTGKTRLALQAAADLLEEFEDGVFFVALATITDPQLLPSTIAAPLGVKESPEQPLIESLKGYLRQKVLLLVLDNFEQVLEGAPLVGELVAACPKLKILATSRIPLRLYGEQEYMVPPLALPDPSVLPPVEVLTQYEAVRLFVERARAVKADFEVTNDNAPAVAEICARLDGLPLAIELAGARIRILPPQKMLERLSDRLKLLKGGARDLPARQQTLRGAIDWSHDLLAEDEKTLFGRLSVFSGGRTLEAIEEICDPEGDLDALEGVESLVEKSLLRQEEEPGGEPRFVMLETVHEYAREKLEESGEAEGIKRAHAEYFLALAEEAEPELKGSDQLEWLERLEVEHDNMRAALAWALESKEEELALRLAGALWWFWHLHGHANEGLGWLERLLRGEGSRAAMARVLHGAGWMAEGQGDYVRAMSLYEEGLALFREAGDDANVAVVAINMGYAAMTQGDHGRALELIEEGLGLGRRLGDERISAWALHHLGVLATERQDHGRARAYLEEALPLARKVGDPYVVSSCLLDLGATYMYVGDDEAANKLGEKALALQRQLGDKEGRAENLCNLALVAMNRGHYERARTLLEDSLALSRELDHKLYIADALNAAGRIAGERGEALRSARLCGAADALREAIRAPLPPAKHAVVRPYLNAARSQLGEAAWEEAHVEGQSMTLEEAVSYALEEEEAGS
jgi:predicted ATPase/class 3 adenylate cyclase